MVNNGNNQLSGIPNCVPDKKKKKLFAISYLDGTAFSWVQPRLENFLENDDKKQKQKTQQMFYKFDNFCIYIIFFSGIKTKTGQLKNNF